MIENRFVNVFGGSCFGTYGRVKVPFRLSVACQTRDLHHMLLLKLTKAQSAAQASSGDDVISLRTTVVSDAIVPSVANNKQAYGDDAGDAFDSISVENGNVTPFAPLERDEELENGTPATLNALRGLAHGCASLLSLAMNGDECAADAFTSVAMVLLAAGATTLVERRSIASLTPCFFTRSLFVPDSRPAFGHDVHPARSFRRRCGARKRPHAKDRLLRHFASAVESVRRSLLA